MTARSTAAASRRSRPPTSPTSTGDWRRRRRTPAIPCSLPPWKAAWCVWPTPSAYIGRDIEDAIILGLIRRDDIPARCRRTLGESNGTIVYNLVTDLIAASTVPPPGETGPASGATIGFSEEIAAALQELKTFNYERIYLAPQTKQDMPLIGRLLRPPSSPPISPA